MARQQSDQALLSSLWFLDVLATGFCWMLAYWLRWDTGLFAAIGDTPPFWWCVRLLPIVLIVAGLCYRSHGLYQVGRRWRKVEEFFRVAKAVGLMLLVTLAITYYIRNPYESRLASVIFGALTAGSLLLNRRVFGAYFRWRRQWGRGAATLIVGSGRLARAVERSLRINPWLGLQPIGYVDDIVTAPGRPPRTVGRIDELATLVETHDVGHVFVALPLERTGDVRRVFRNLANTLVEIRVAPDVPRLSALAVSTGELEGMPILSLANARHEFAGQVAKRVMDVVLSALGLLILSPFLATIALIIKFSDRGPVFYIQERMGLNGHRFKMLKFRSMRVNAESETGPVWATNDDKRKTRFGAFLRATSIDELPQLINVLLGDMSLVGPRPERPYFIDTFRRSIPRYMIRHAMKSGITGWAQIHGWRGNTSLRKRVQYDLYYIANWSLWLDIRILVLTVFKILKDPNAY